MKTWKRFVCSRKFDPDIFRLALHIAQVPPEQIVDIENTAMSLDITESLGIHSVLRTDSESTRAKLTEVGLQCDKGGTEK